MVRKKLIALGLVGIIFFGTPTVNTVIVNATPKNFISSEDPIIKLVIDAVNSLEKFIDKGDYEKAISWKKYVDHEMRYFEGMNILPEGLKQKYDELCERIIILDKKYKNINFLKDQIKYSLETLDEYIRTENYKDVSNKINYIQTKMDELNTIDSVDKILINKFEQLKKFISESGEDVKVKKMKDLISNYLIDLENYINKEMYEKATWTKNYIDFSIQKLNEFTILPTEIQNKFDVLLKKYNELKIKAETEKDKENMIKELKKTIKYAFFDLDETLRNKNYTRVPEKITEISNNMCQLEKYDNYSEYFTKRLKECKDIYNHVINNDPSKKMKNLICNQLTALENYINKEMFEKATYSKKYINFSIKKLSSITSVPVEIQNKFDILSIKYNELEKKVEEEKVIQDKIKNIKTLIKYSLLDIYELLNNKNYNKVPSAIKTASEQMTILKKYQEVPEVFTNRLQELKDKYNNRNGIDPNRKMKEIVANELDYLASYINKGKFENIKDYKNIVEFHMQKLASVTTIPTEMQNKFDNLSKKFLELKKKNDAEKTEQEKIKDIKSSIKYSLFNINQLLNDKDYSKVSSAIENASKHIAELKKYEKVPEVFTNRLQELKIKYNNREGLDKNQQMKEIISKELVHLENSMNNKNFEYVKSFKNTVDFHMQKLSAIIDIPNEIQNKFDSLSNKFIELEKKAYVEKIKQEKIKDIKSNIKYSLFDLNELLDKKKYDKVPEIITKVSKNMAELKEYGVVSQFFTNRLQELKDTYSNRGLTKL